MFLKPKSVNISPLRVIVCIIHMWLCVHIFSMLLCVCLFCMYVRTYVITELQVVHANHKCYSSKRIRNAKLLIVTFTTFRKTQGKSLTHNIQVEKIRMEKPLNQIRFDQSKDMPGFDQQSLHTQRRSHQSRHT